MNTDNPYDASEAAVELITQFEGKRQQAYLCPANRLTIGCGHVILPKWDFGLFRIDAGTLARIVDECQSRRILTQEAQVVLTISHEQVKQLLHRDVQQTALFLRSITPVLINQNQFDALVSLIFNIGQGKYAQSTLRHKLHGRDFAGAAAEFDRWVMGTIDGKKAPLPGLVKRRAAERALFEKPV
ncbi:lysozyme [Methylomonas sp. 2BW1-5-20]|uniref:lysozyme n=1 Tax=Methylomonas sp. 2BW1-5-20 TaxID=3376686 RepID=UPI00405094E4